VITGRVLAWFKLLRIIARVDLDEQVRFLKAENEILRSRIKGNRVILKPTERAKLLSIGEMLGHKVEHLISIVTFKTYQRWVCELLGSKVTNHVGRPREITDELRKLVIRLAKQNMQWGYRRIVGELLKLKISISKSTVMRILNDADIYPDPDKDKPGNRSDTAWRAFVRLHINTIVACDFFCKNIWTVTGTQCAYCLMFIHLGSRRIWTSPATYHPNAQWINQKTRHATMWMEEHHIKAEYLIRDRDSKYTNMFDCIFESQGTAIKQAPVRAPDANAFAESCIGSIKRECLNYFLCFSLRHLDYILHFYTNFYNRCRPHQSRSNLTLPNAMSGLPPPSDKPTHIGKITSHRELSGLLKHYDRTAA